MRGLNRIFAAISLALLVGGCTQSQSLIGQEPQLTIDELVRAQAAAEYGMQPGRFDGEVAGDSIHLEPTNLLDAVNLRVERAFLPIDHAHPYLLLSSPRGLITLGGFSEVQLSEAFAALGLSVTDSSTAVEVSRLLSALADDNGAQRLVLNIESPEVGEHKAVTAWDSFRPDDWPSDTVAQKGPSYFSVRFTVLSQAVNSYVQAWEPTVYQFDYAQGTLAGWARMKGEPFHYKNE